MFEYREVGDVEAAAELAKRAFVVRQPGQQALGEWLTSSLEGGRKLLGVYDEQTLAAVYMLYDFRMRLRGSVVPMGGIGLLCSRMDARGKGAVRLMLRGALETMRAAGHVVSVLNPFDESFYRKYGWELFERCQKLEVSPGGLDVRGEDDCEAVDLAFPDEASMAFYNEYARCHHTLVQRGRVEWERRVTISPGDAEGAARGVVRVSRADRVVGLIGYRLSCPAGAWRPTLTVELFAAADEGAVRAMLRYIKRLSHQVKVVRFELPVDVDLWPYFADRANNWTIEDCFMIRIVSMASLDGLAIEAQDQSVCLEVDDAQAPWNAGTWRWTVRDGVLRVGRADRGDLRCGIGALSSILSGFTDFRAMIAAGRVEPFASYAGQDLPRAATFLADYF